MNDALLLTPDDRNDWFGFNADGYPCTIANGNYIKTLKAFAKECGPEVVRIEQASGERRAELFRLHIGEDV